MSLDVSNDINDPFMIQSYFLLPYLIGFVVHVCICVGVYMCIMYMYMSGRKLSR